jgi:hypothetical protein
VLARIPAPWLLIFDNAADLASVAGFLPPAGPGRVLITSQNPNWPGQPLDVPVLDLEVAHGVPPASWTASLKAIVSRIRAVITGAGLDGGWLIAGAPGVYRFMLPPSGWVDIDAAKSAAHEGRREAGERGSDAVRAAYVRRQTDNESATPARHDRPVAQDPTPTESYGTFGLDQALISRRRPVSTS